MIRSSIARGPAPTKARRRRVVSLQGLLRVGFLVALAILPSSSWLRPSVVQGQEAAHPGDRERTTRVPRWDARGVGRTPRQGIACLDVSEDARFIAVGTAAPPGDPNVVLLDGDGRVVRSHAVGQRWVERVTVDRSGGRMHALSTMPAGRAGDFCTVFRCGAGVEAVADPLGQDDFALNLFHYGDHSNHLGASLRDGGSGATAVMGDRVYWPGSGDAQSPRMLTFPRPRDAVTTASAAGPGGQVLVGCTGRLDAKDGESPNLFLLVAGNPRPVWARQALADLDDRPAPEPGRYGTPTLPDGSREALPQRDVRVSAPLSVALFARPELSCVAAADYPGWQRWVRSSATAHDQNHGTRFLPARPTVTVYDARGEILRRFGPDSVPAGRLARPEVPAGGEAADRLSAPLDQSRAGGPAEPPRRRRRPDRVRPRRRDRRGPIDRVPGRRLGPGRGRRRAGSPSPAGTAGSTGSMRTSRRPSSRPRASTSAGPGWSASSGTARAIVATSGGVVLRLDKRWAGNLAHRPRRRRCRPPRSRGSTFAPSGSGRASGSSRGVASRATWGGSGSSEAPGGLILIEGHAGLSFEREWAAIASTGLDPSQVKYVLATHEHGDHAPGAYLWRVATGAQFVCSAEMAYSLQHHIPLGSGYGFHPPVPTDLRVTHDDTLDLAGLPVRAVRIPGHTFGSMAWMFEAGGKRYVATGDLIMPGGVLGYDGSINFSATDVLASLRKLDALKPDVVLPGHGADGDPGPYLAAGIDVGVHVGWGKIRPERPDPYFRMTQKNVRVVAWNLGATSADFGDIDGDGRPDVAVVVPDGDDAAVVKLFLNRGGTFPERPDREIRVPGVAAPTKIRLRRLNDDRVADFLVGGRSAALGPLARGVAGVPGRRLWTCRMRTRCVWATPTRTASVRSWSVPASVRSRSRGGETTSSRRNRWCRRSARPMRT